MSYIWSPRVSPTGIISNVTCRLLNIGILSSIRSQRHKLFSWLATRGFFEKIASHKAGVTSTQFKSRVIRLCNCSPWHYRASAIDRWVACEIPPLPMTEKGGGSISKKGSRSRASSSSVREIHGNFTKD